MKNIQEFIEKAHELNKQNPLDLSCDEDLSIAIMNLISIEEHFFFTGAKTGKTSYYDLINEVRTMRKDLLKKLITDYEGEVWCIGKHLLAASMRLMEVGTKQLTLKNKAEAYQLFNQSYTLYCLFWGLVMKAIKTDDIKQIDEHALHKEDTEHKNGLLDSLRSLVQRVINCCIE